MFRSLRFPVAAAAALLLLAVPAQAREAPIPKDVGKFTAYMAERFGEALPGWKVVVTGPLMLDAGTGKDKQQIRLANVWDYCERDRRACRRAIADYVASMSGTVRESGTEPSVANIRVEVRGPGIAAELKRVAAAQPENAPIFRHIAGDLWLVCVIDMPHGTQTPGRQAFAKLGLTEDQAIAAGIRNVAAALPPLKEHTHEVKPYGITYAAGDYYESSRMLLHDSWKEMSDAMHGNLVVAVPETHVIVFGNGTGNGDRAVLSAVAKTVAEKADKPISVALFRWTPAGWEVAPP